VFYRPNGRYSQEPRSNSRLEDAEQGASLLGDGVGKEVWQIKSRALVSDVTWVVLQDGTKYAPFVASRDFNRHLIRHEGKGIMAKILFRQSRTDERSREERATHLTCVGLGDRLR
jgi:hypothetical protein